MFDTVGPNMGEQTHEQDNDGYIDLSDQAKRKLAELIQLTERCFEGDRRQTTVANKNDVRRLKIGLARIIRSHIDCTVNHHRIWIDKDVRSGIHIYVFHHKPSSRQAFTREHAHYYADRDGSLKLCHGYRKSRWKIHRPAVVTS